MRILILPSWYPTPSNPIKGIFVREQADALHLAQEVRVLYLDVLPRGQKRTPKHLSRNVRGYIEDVVEVPNKLLIWQFAYLWYLYRAFRSLRRQFAPDIIHCHVAVPAGWGAAALRPIFGVP